MDTSGHYTFPTAFQTVVAVTFGLVITAVYLTRRRKSTQKPDDSTRESTLLHPEVSNCKKSTASNHVTSISGEKVQNNNLEIDECHSLIETLEKQVDFEKARRTESENCCALMEKELQTNLKAKKEIEAKYETLLKRYDVITDKLKASEERCRRLMEALNSVDSDGELYPIVNDDDYDDDVIDDVIEECPNNSYNDTPSPESRPYLRLQGSGEKTPDFELEMNVMEALVATAVMDIDEDTEDTESLTDLILNNLSEEDLNEHVRDEGTLDTAVDDIAQEEMLYTNTLQEAGDRKGSWDKQSSGTETCLSPAPSFASCDVDFQRSSPFHELQKRWNSHMSSEDQSESSLANNQDSCQATDSLDNDDGRFLVKVGKLKQKMGRNVGLKGRNVTDK